MFDNPPDVLITPSDLITFAKVSFTFIILLNRSLFYRILRDAYASTQDHLSKPKLVEHTQVLQLTHSSFQSKWMKMIQPLLATEQQTESESTFSTFEAKLAYLFKGRIRGINQRICVFVNKFKNSQINMCFS